jgi:hypothetical protein
MRVINPKVELASGEYDRRLQVLTQPGIDVVARLFGIRPKTLANYRANYLSPSHGKSRNRHKF